MGLDRNVVPRKTARGQQEIAEKLDSISPQLRRALLIVDGVKNFETLFQLGKVFGGEASFAALLEAGMIEIAGGSGGSAPSASAAGGGATGGGTLDLRKFAIDALKGVYGAGIVKEVDKIAKKYPPETMGGEFLDACAKKAMMMMNKNEVKQLLQPAYDSIR